jgi:hypothetical protein
MTDELLDVMAERGADGSPVEFMHDFAFQLPVTVICELLGIPEADRAGFRPLARDLAATVEVGVDLPVLQAADAAAVRQAGRRHRGGRGACARGHPGPCRFTAPDTFDPLRPDVVPLSFGAGAQGLRRVLPSVGPDLADRPNRVGLVRILVGPEPDHAGEPEREAARVAAAGLDPVERDLHD